MVMRVELAKDGDKVEIPDAYDFALQIMAYHAGIWANTIYSWSDEFYRKAANEALETSRIETMRDPTFWERVMLLPDELRLNLGFRYWDEESKAQGKMLMPFWIYAILPDDFEFGGKKKSDVDNDKRCGCVFWLV